MVGGAREVPFNPNGLSRYVWHSSCDLCLAPVLREGLDVTVRGSDMLNSGRT